MTAAGHNAASGTPPSRPTADPRGRARRRALLAAAVLLGLFALNAVWIVRSLRGLGGRGPAVGRAAPEFTATKLGGGTVTLGALRGRVVLLDFWATWCEPCITAMPALKRLHAAFAARGLSLIGVNIDGPAARAAVADFVHEAGLGYPVVLDDGRLSDRYRVRELPHVVLIDRHGVVRRIFAGETTEVELRRAVEEALRQAAAR